MLLDFSSSSSKMKHFEYLYFLYCCMLSQLAQNAFTSLLSCSTYSKVLMRQLCIKSTALGLVFSLQHFSFSPGTHFSADHLAGQLFHVIEGAGQNWSQVSAKQFGVHIRAPKPEGQGEPNPPWSGSRAEWTGGLESQIDLVWKAPKTTFELGSVEQMT